MTERIIILHLDTSMPSESLFMPSFWEMDDYYVQGDYYYEGIENRWTELTLKTREETEENNTLFELLCFRENRNYEPGLQEIYDLHKYIDNFRNGDYKHISEDLLDKNKYLAVSALSIHTNNPGRVSEFKDTVSMFLKNMNGFII